MPTCTHPRMATCAGGFWKLSAPCGWKAVVGPREWKEPVQKHAARWQQGQALNTPAQGFCSVLAGTQAPPYCGTSSAPLILPTAWGGGCLTLRKARTL